MKSGKDPAVRIGRKELESVLSYVSHDFRNPITSVKAYLQLASRQGLLLNVFPNPSTGKFVVRVSQPVAAAASLEILNLQGRRLYTQALPAQSTGEYRINAPGLARGAYLVRLITQGGSTTQKLLIE
jgi:signal transduction histidine kinase